MASYDPASVNDLDVFLDAMVHEVERGTVDARDAYTTMLFYAARLEVESGRHERERAPPASNPSVDPEGWI